MDHDPLTEREDRLRARLTAEAAADRPQFSQALHDRIVQAVREAPHTVAAAKSRRRIAAGLFWAGSAAAVAVTLAVWIGRGAGDPAAGRPAPAVRSAERASHADPGPPAGNGLTEDSREPALVGTAPAAEHLAILVDTTFAASQWAYLDHDARLAAGMVLRHIPFEFPAEARHE